MTAPISRGALSRDALAGQLVEARIAGDVATPRENNLRNYGRLANREPLWLFGLEPEGRWEPADVLALMAKRCGVSPDPDHTEGPDTIDPQLTIERLDDVARELRVAVAEGAPVLLATGHPTGLLAVYIEVARALTSAGVTLLTPAASWVDEVHDTPAGAPHEVREREIRYVGGVAVVSHRGNLRHTHDSAPMRLMLDALRRDGAWPSLVVADHGFAGAAGQAGVRTVGFADSNDPGLFVGEAEGRLATVVPLDDNVAPHLYAEMTTYLLHRAGL